MQSAAARFLTEYGTAFDKELTLSNKAHEAYENASCYLTGFTLDNKGLTPDEAKKLLQLLDEYARAQGDVFDAEYRMNDALQRLELAFRKFEKKKQ